MLDFYDGIWRRNMGTIKELFTNWRIILLIVFLIFAVIAIGPTSQEGVAIRNVISNSSTADAGIPNPKPTDRPTSREVIIAMNNVPIKNNDDYTAFITTLEPNQTFTIETTTGFYRVTSRYEKRIIMLNETELVERIVDNETVTEEVQKTEIQYLGMEDIGLRVYNAPQTNLRKGLDLQGGTRVLLQPETKLNVEDMGILIENMKQRLNVYGLADIIIREAGDLSGNQYVLVEIAGTSEEEVKDLLAKQGKFAATVGNETVFRGGQDVTYVCRTADCAGIDPQAGCQGSTGSFVCRFSFAISLSPEAAQRQADATRDLQIVEENGQSYLSDPIILYLDDQEVDRLQIASDLRGRAVTDISISGSGAGRTRDEAVFTALANMKSLQTILITGSLPVKLNIVQTTNLSPALGEEFLKNAILIGILAILTICVVVFIRYRKLVISIPMLITSLSELVLLLGFAALVGWNLDLAALAGIIIAVGTGVDHQIVITDETLRRESQAGGNWKRQLKAAFFIIFVAYATTMFAMAPLLFAGAGLVKGFALTTMAGVTFGVLITRPAYATIIRILLNR